MALNRTHESIGDVLLQFEGGVDLKCNILVYEVSFKNLDPSSTPLTKRQTKSEVLKPTSYFGQQKKESQTGQVKTNQNVEEEKDNLSPRAKNAKFRATLLAELE